MKKTTLLAIIFLSMAITGYGCVSEENDKYDCRMHYRQSLLRTLNYFEAYWREHKHYPKWTTEEYLSEVKSSDLLDDLNTGEIRYIYAEDGFFELSGITKMQYGGDNYSVFLLTPAGAFWMDNLAGKDDTLEKINYEKINHQIYRRFRNEDGTSVYIELPLPNREWNYGPDGPDIWSKFSRLF